MKQFTTKADEPLSVKRLGKILKEFQTDQLPKFIARKNYYDGRQAILSKVASDDSKPCNKIVCNFVKNIVQTYEGYALGNPVSYSSDDQGIEELEDILKYNDCIDEDAEYFRKGLIYGRCAEICYFDEEGKPRFRCLAPTECIPVYDDTLAENLLYAIRFWIIDYIENDTPVYMVEVFDEHYKTTYKSSHGFASFELLAHEEHHFPQVPVSFFELNDEEEAVAEPIFSLQDAYNSLISDALDDWDAFCDAYMVIKGCDADDDDLADMKDHRILILDTDSSAEYLTKNTTSTEIEHLLTTCEEKIREMSACPNFASETFGTSSGIAIKYRCMALENNTAAMLSNFKKALQKRIELLADVSAIVNGEALWRDIKITFTRNLPVNESEIATEINSLRGLVSDRTLLTQIPFVTDVDEELKLLDEQKQANMETYGFGDVNTDTENELLDEETDGRTE